LPLPRILRTWKYGQNDDTEFLLGEEHRLRKTPYTHTMDVLVLSREAQRLLGRDKHRLGTKFAIKAQAPCFLPESCVLEITTRTPRGLRVGLAAATQEAD